MRLQRVGHNDTHTHTHTHTHRGLSEFLHVSTKADAIVLMEEKIEKHRAHVTSRALVTTVPDGNSGCRGLFLPETNLHLESHL